MENIIPSIGVVVSETLGILNRWDSRIPQSILTACYSGVSLLIAVLQPGYWKQREQQKLLKKTEMIAITVQQILESQMKQHQLTDSEKEELQNRIRQLECLVSANRQPALQI